MSTTLKQNQINGCPVIREKAGVSMIEHPTGFMIYSGGPRVATLKTRAGADRRFERETQRQIEHDRSLASYDRALGEGRN